MNQADTSAWRGMALEATAPSPVQLMYIVSNSCFKNEFTGFFPRLYKVPPAVKC